MQEKTKQIMLDILAAVFGSAFVAIGVALFTAPNNIAPGGVSGLATAVASLLNNKVTIGILSLIFNIPIVIMGLKKLGLRPIITTLLATVLLSVFIDLAGMISKGYTNNTLMAAVAGGVFCGIGTGILFIRGSSTGGTDLLSLVLKVYFPNMEVGRILLIVDGLVVLFAVIIFHDIEVALYSVVTIFVSSRVVDAIVQGIDYAKVVYVITEKGEELSRVLIEKTDRSTTIIPAQGGYTGRDKSVLMIVVRRNEFYQTLGIIKEVDRAAFIIATSATEVHGEGFKPIEKD